MTSEMHDMLGLYGGKVPSFVKKYMDGRAAVLEALNGFDAEVKTGTFPGGEKK